MKRIEYYFRILKTLVKYSLLRDLEYRTSFFSNLISSVGWQSMALISILLLNRTTGGFGGWNENQMLLLLGTWMINNSLAYFLFYRNMKDLVVDIVKGNLDLLLSKPLDSQFLVSTRKTSLSALGGIITGPIVISYSLNQLGTQIDLVGILGFILLIVVSQMIYYSLWFFAATLSIHFSMTDNLFFVVPELVEFSRYPDTAFPSLLMYFMYTLIPVLLMTTLPAQLLLGALNIQSYLYALFVGALFFTFTRWFWQWSLSKYTSASS